MASNREVRLMPNGVPRYIRCYDNGGASIDRYTVVYTGRYRRRIRGGRWGGQWDAALIHVCMNAAPFHPQGFGQHGESDHLIDRPTSSHLGRRIQFTDLPEDCQRLVVQDYRELWNIPTE